MKRPSFQFYPADWRKDAELQSCSVTARGLWHEALCIMHECEPYGELRVNGKPMGTPQLARLVGMTTAECQRALGELEDAGVPSRRDDGALYSRRMVRDEQVRNARSLGGHEGAEHGQKGAEYGSKGGRPRKETGVKKPPLIPPPSSSSSPSSAVQETSSLRSDVCPEPSQAQASVPEPAVVECPKFLLRPQPHKPQSPSFIELETNRDGETFTITEAHVAQFAGLYPGVDVRQELRGMKGWLFSNPAQRKTAKGMLRFVNGWLDREQNKPKPKAGSARPSFSDPDQFKIINPLEQMQ